MLPDLDRLIELQEIDTRAAAAGRAIAEGPARIASLDALLHQAEADVAGARQRLADNHAARRAIEKDLVSAQQRQEKYKDQLMAVKTNEEYHAMQHQIAAVAVEVGQVEERSLVNMLEADEVHAAIKAAEAALAAARARVGAERAAIEQQVRDHEAVAAECAARRAAVVAAMADRGLIDTFERIARVRGTAVARAEHERCTVCQVRLRPAVFQSVLRNDSFVQCESCQRILFFAPPT